MGDIAHKYYTGLFRREETCPEKQDQFTNLLQDKLTGDQQETLRRPITLGEVYFAIRHSKNTKAPGDDGLTNEFYNRYKEELGPFLTCLFREWQAGMLPEFKTSLICLLYKNGDATLMKN
jgi:hypothetical protein